MASVDTLTQRTPIVDAQGRATIEFMIKWQQLMGAAGSIPALKTQAEVSAVLDVVAAVEGDVLIRGASLWEGLPVGSAGQVVSVSGGLPAWENLSVVFDASFGGSAGDLFYRGASAWGGLAIGSTGQALGVSGGLPAWSSISALLDAAFSSTRGAVLFRGASAWQALAPGTAGQVLTSGGAGADVSWAAAATLPQYELGQFKPPLAAWFSTAGGGLTPTLTDYAQQGLLVYGTGFASANVLALAGRNPAGWTTPWAVTARVVSSPAHDNFPFAGLFLVDNSGKAQGVMAQSAITSSLSAAYNTYDVRLNNTNGSYNSAGRSVSAYRAAQWFRIRNDGTNFYFGTSYEGLVWEEYPTAVGAFLGTLTTSAIAISMWNSASVGSPADTGAALVTYYSDPDHP